MDNVAKMFMDVEVVSQSHTIPACDLEYFMLTVAIESCPRYGGCIIVTPIVRDLLSSTSNLELATWLDCLAYPFN